MRLCVVMIVSGSAMHVLVLFLFFLKNRRCAQAALWGKMADIVDDVPHLFVFLNPFPSRHAGRLDAVFNDPLQLAVSVVLHVFYLEICHRRWPLFLSSRAPSL